MNDFVRIGHPNNPPDFRRGFRGCVPYVYEMARHALANAEWCAFLNAVGESTVWMHGLWHKDMASGILGGIDYLEGRYVPKSGWERKPVVYVSYTSLLRYCNWLQSGETERGAYDLSAQPPQRLPGARFFLPTDDEWYKAAYYDPQESRYWLYPTRSDEIPSQDQANFERGDAFAPLALAETPPTYLVDVESFAESPSPWGVVQMGGNCWEYLEDTWCLGVALSNKLRGGSFGYTETGLSSTNTDAGKYDCRCYVFGARLAQCPDGWRPRRNPLRYRVAAAALKALARIRRVLGRLK